MFHLRPIKSQTSRRVKKDFLYAISGLKQELVKWVFNYLPHFTLVKKELSFNKLRFLNHGDIPLFSLSSEINAVLCPQRVNFALEKDAMICPQRAACAGHPVRNTTIYTTESPSFLAGQYL